MATVETVLDALESIAPRRFALDFDRVGLQVGDPGAHVGRGVVSLDRSLGAVDFAIEKGANLLVSHHPLIFKPLDRVVADDHVGRTILSLASANIAFIAAHTNWDAAKGGINDALAARLGLLDVRPFGIAAETERFKLVVFVPEANLQNVIDAAAMAGAGVIGAYERCAFWSGGTGSFLPGSGAHPTVGVPGSVEETPELRLEMAVPAGAMRDVERAVRDAHPYEEPAIDFVRLSDGDEMPLGRVGGLKEPTSLAEFAKFVELALGTSCWTWGGAERRIRTVAVVGGAADDEWRAARHEGADVFLTGEVRQHVALEASESGFAVIAAGHYATEQPGCAALRDRLAAAIPEVDWLLFEPEPGSSGRPLLP